MSPLSTQVGILLLDVPLEEPDSHSWENSLLTSHPEVKGVTFPLSFLEFLSGIPALARASPMPWAGCRIWDFQENSWQSSSTPRPWAGSSPAPFSHIKSNIFLSPHLSKPTGIFWVGLDHS